MSILQAWSVTKHFHGNAVVKEVSLDVDKGETVCIFGPSGAGKSTFLRCLNQLERLDGGTVYLDGELVGFREHRGMLYELSNRALAKQRRHIGMVFQQFNLFPHKTVLENIIESPVGVLRQPRAECEQHAEPSAARRSLREA